MAVVLVVDDNHEIARAVATLLRVLHHEAVIAHGGREAVDHIAAHHVDVVILDVSMPGMSGLDVLRELAAGGRLAALPVVMFSASDECRDEALRLGAVEFVRKHEADGLPALIDRYTAGSIPAAAAAKP